MSEITIRIERREAKKLLQALYKGTWEKLTKAQAAALDDFLTNLLIEVGP